MTQKERIIDFLETGRKLDRLNSWYELGILELPARIHELRAEGYPIVTKLVPVENRYGEKVKVAEYSMEVTSAA